MLAGPSLTEKSPRPRFNRPARGTGADAKDRKVHEAKLSTLNSSACRAVWRGEYALVFSDFGVEGRDRIF